MDYFSLIDDDPELSAKQDEFVRIGRLMRDVQIAMNEDRLSEKTGRARIDSLIDLHEEASQGPVFERLQKVYYEIAARMHNKIEAE